MLASIRDIIMISTPQNVLRFRHLIGARSSYGVHLTYVEQPASNRRAHASTIVRSFIGADSVALMFAGNIFYGVGLGTEDVIEIRPRRFQGGGDFFSEIWNEQGWADAGITGEFVQDKHSGKFVSDHGFAMPDWRASLAPIVARLAA